MIANPLPYGRENKETGSQGDDPESTSGGAWPGRGKREGTAWRHVTDCNGRTMKGQAPDTGTPKFLVTKFEKKRRKKTYVRELDKTHPDR